ncbi:hypothetical protein RUM44_004005 [Polyplax serrata]|uniref:MADF domain-containing protein n=1 Tax=Polyplax serrata TaxID=468196 RepID=A0ABR1B203_POLSC
MAEAFARLSDFDQVCLLQVDAIPELFSHSNSWAYTHADTGTSYKRNIWKELTSVVHLKAEDVPQEKAAAGRSWALRVERWHPRLTSEMLPQTQYNLIWNFND